MDDTLTALADVSIIDAMIWLGHRYNDELHKPGIHKPGVDVGREYEQGELWIYPRTNLMPSELDAYFGPMTRNESPLPSVVNRVQPELDHLDTRAGRVTFWRYVADDTLRAEAVRDLLLDDTWREKVLDGEDDVLLTIKRAARRACVSETQVRRWRDKGMPTMRPPEGQRGETVQLSDLLAWQRGKHPKQQQATPNAAH